MEKIFFDSWQSLIRTLIITVLAYIALVVLLRISGKRTLSKMNAFDFVVTIALGSAFATVTLSKDVTLADGCLVFLVLVALQYSITWLSVRFSTVKRLITSRPQLLLYKGELFTDMLKKERITTDEIYVALRKKGIAQLKDADAIILETAGEITVISRLDDNNLETLQDVSKP